MDTSGLHAAAMETAGGERHLFLPTGGEYGEAGVVYDWGIVLRILRASCDRGRAVAGRRLQT
ncbi:hypothetical protein [Halalkalibacter flavus]|uniref:hypothetical protein n=1 Tax=Halalkalibacter flavus TaxID=3090668 RepID=UPI002FC5AFFC